MPRKKTWQQQRNTYINRLMADETFLPNLTPAHNTRIYNDLVSAKSERQVKNIIARAEVASRSRTKSRGRFLQFLNSPVEG